MVNSVSNLKGTTNIQNTGFGSEIALVPSLENKPDEVNFSGKNNTGKKLLLGAAVVAALVGFRGKIANVINKYFPNFFKTVGEKFTTFKRAIINFFKTHTPDKGKVTQVVNNAKENLSKGVNATKEGITKGIETAKDGLTKGITGVKDNLSKGVSSAKDGINKGYQEVSEIVKNKLVPQKTELTKIIMKFPK